MSVRLKHLFDTVDALCKVDPQDTPQGELWQLHADLCEAWSHLPDDKLMRLINFIEGWAEASGDQGYDVAVNLLMAWHSYSEATK